MMSEQLITHERTECRGYNVISTGSPFSLFFFIYSPVAGFDSRLLGCLFRGFRYLPESHLAIFLSVRNVT